MTLLGLDLGTTNVKAIVTDGRGQILGRSAVPVQVFYVREGGVEQDIEEIWSATLSAIRQAASSVDRADIRTIGVSSQGGALQVLGPQGEPVGRVISWLDGRGRADDETLTRELGREWFVRRTAHDSSGLAIGQLLRLRRECALGLRPSNRIGFVGDVIVSRLCGCAAHDGTSCALALLYNPALRTYDPDVLQRLGVSPAQLPALSPPTVAAGGLLPEVARQVGLPAGIPVSPAIHDQYAAALGSGAVHPGDVMFGAGTAWVLLAVMDRLAGPVIDGAFVCHHVVEGLYGQIVSLRNGGSALNWALRLTGLENLNGADLEQVVGSARPGADGLLFWPFLAPAAPVGLAADTKGRLEGLQLSHTRAHVLRAVVEGLACELNRHLQLLREADVPVERLVMCGGAATGTTTPQIIADVTDLPVSCQPAGESSLLGAAILARGLAQPREPLDQLATEMIPSARGFTPGQNAAFYRQRFAEYRRSLPVLRATPAV